MVRKRKQMTQSNVRKFVEEWNVRYPVDVWWRNKYKIPFGSKLHREANFIDMIIEWEEDKMFNEIATATEKQIDKEDQLDLSDLQKFTKDGRYISKVVEMSEDEVDDEFNNLNLSEFNDQIKEDGDPK